MTMSGPPEPPHEPVPVPPASAPFGVPPESSAPGVPPIPPPMGATSPPPSAPGQLPPGAPPFPTGTPGAPPYGGGAPPPYGASATATAGRAPWSGLVLPGAVVVILIAIVVAFTHRQNHSERLASAITKAIINNDMSPVAGDFNAIVRPKLANRAYVGRLSDQLHALGDFKGVKETTPSGAAAGLHTFDAQFAQATWNEDLTLDAEGKVASFHVHPSTGPATSP